MQVKQYLSFTVWPLMMTSLVLGGGRYPPELVPLAISVEERRNSTYSSDHHFSPAGPTTLSVVPVLLESAFVVQWPLTRASRLAYAASQGSGLSGSTWDINHAEPGHMIRLWLVHLALPIPFPPWKQPSQVTLGAKGCVG